MSVPGGTKSNLLEKKLKLKEWPELHFAAFLKRMNALT